MRSRNIRQSPEAEELGEVEMRSRKICHSPEAEEVGEVEMRSLSPLANTCILKSLASILYSFPRLENQSDSHC